MHPIFSHLETLCEKTHTSWFNSDAKNRAMQERASRCTELRIMYITVVLFEILTATFALTLTSIGLLAPITSGHIASGCVKLIVGAGLSFLAYDIHNLRLIVSKTRDIFDESMRSNRIQQKWISEIEELRRLYIKKLFLVSQLLEFVWPVQNYESP